MAEEASTARKPESDRLDPWIEDGNIVLVVEGKYFRVHRSILSSYSEVFKGMFDVFDRPETAGSEGEKELIEECPVIHLHDAATDVQIVLKAMYDRSYPLPYYEKAPFPIISAFLRLGDKYAIQRLFDEAKARLRCPFEPTLNVAARITSSHSGSFMLFPGVTGCDPHNFQMMNLLQEMDLYPALPLAMYQCITTCPLPTVIDGYEFNGSTCLLSYVNLRSFIHMKSILESFRVRLAQNLRVSASCVVQSSCVCNIRRLWSDEVTIAQPFGPWRSEWDKLFCDACRSDLNMWRNAAIQKTWNQIPIAFAFESWAAVAN